MASDDWFVGSAFPVLEKYLCRAENQPMQSRYLLRKRLAEAIPALAEECGKSVEDTVLTLVRGASDMNFMRGFLRAATWLDLLYGATTFFEFADDIFPIDEQSAF